MIDANRDRVRREAQRVRFRIGRSHVRYGLGSHNAGMAYVLVHALTQYKRAFM
jgi:hypothetical protein